MLVKATRTGYYGDKIRKPGSTFNYVPAMKPGEKEPPFPSWMEKVNVGAKAESHADRAEKLERLTVTVNEAKQALLDAEAVATEAENDLANAKTKQEKADANESVQAANDAVEDAVLKVSEAEDALATAEAE